MVAVTANARRKTNVTVRLHRSRTMGVAAMVLATAPATANRKRAANARAMAKDKVTGRAVSVVRRTRKPHNRRRRLHNRPSNRSTVCLPKRQHCSAAAKPDVHAQ